MQREKHYLMVGSFVIVTILITVLFSIWLVGSQDRNKYSLYRIRFTESVSGLSVGSPVKFRGMDVGAVKTMEIDPDDINRIRVDVNILKTAPIKNDTVATLKLLGITGNVYIELTGGQQNAGDLAATSDAPPEITSQPSTISTVMDMLPEITKKISAISDQLSKLLSNKNINALGDTIKNFQDASHNASDVTKTLKKRPHLLLWGNAEEGKQEKE